MSFHGSQVRRLAIGATLALNGIACGQDPSSTGAMGGSGALAGGSGVGGSTSNASGGSSSATGGASAQGGTSSGGSSALGGQAGSATTAGQPNVGGAGAAGAPNGGASTSGAGGATASVGGAPSAGTGACGSATRNAYPFGCKFAWGVSDQGVPLSNYPYMQFATQWIDSTIGKAGTYTTCHGCNWLKNSVASTNLIPAFYAYIIGFLAHANGIVDGNQEGSKKLTTDGAALVKANRAAIVAAYGWYAKETYKVWPSKPLVWLMEGDFVQLVDAGQTSPMTYAEVGQLAADVTCAIKANMPNAVVALNQSSWNSDQTTNSFWAAMKDVNYDLVWTTGVANNNGFLEAGATNSTYNRATATYAYLHTLTGRNIVVDTSAGISAQPDTWSTRTVAELNARISDGVIGLTFASATPSGLQSNVANLASSNALPGCQ